MALQLIFSLEINGVDLNKNPRLFSQPGMKICKVLKLQ